jgi:hypothetical protein
MYIILYNGQSNENYTQLFNVHNCCNICIPVKPVLRGHPLRQSKYGLLKTGDLLKRGSIHKKFSITGQEKDDLLIQVTA